jgi:hypothetical protein
MTNLRQISRSGDLAGVYNYKTGVTMWLQPDVDIIYLKFMQTLIHMYSLILINTEQSCSIWLPLS